MDPRSGSRKRQLRDAAAVGNMGGPRGTGRGSELQVGDEALDPAMKAERFFELIARIRDMKESWARARRGSNNNDAPTPTPTPAWTPRLCWADFAPAPAPPAATATAGSHEEEQGHVEAVAMDANHCRGSEATLDRTQVGAVAPPGNDDGPSNQGRHMTSEATGYGRGNQRYFTADASAVDQDSRRTSALPNVWFADRRSGGPDSGAAGTGESGGGKESTGTPECSLELKLAL